MISLALFTERYPSAIFSLKTLHSGKREESHSFLPRSMYHIPSRFCQSGTFQSADAISGLKRCRIESEPRSDPGKDSGTHLPWKEYRPPTGIHNAVIQISFQDGMKAIAVARKKKEQIYKAVWSEDYLLDDSNIPVIIH